MKKKYYLIALLLMVGAIIGYHFYAASQAEEQIDKAIREQSDKYPNLSVQYSSVEVAPFSATVSIRDLTIVLGKHIERAEHLQLDLSYLDFLNIYIGGLKYGLNHLLQATMTAVKPSYVNRSGLEEFKSDELVITYEGNALDGLVSAVEGTPFSKPQSIKARSSGLVIQLPQTTLSKIEADQFRYTGSVAAGEKDFWTRGNHQFAMDSLTWTPSESFQNSYSFFIKGFGYPTDAIPFQSAQLHFKPEKTNMLRIESSVRSELALFSGSGYLLLEKRLPRSEFQEMKISITKFSESFQRVINNIENLLSISLPKSETGITFYLKGTLSDPQIARP